MENKEKVIEHLVEHRRGLVSKRALLLAPLLEIEKEIEHVSAVITSLQKRALPAAFTASISIDFPLSKIRGKTQVQALGCSEKPRN